MKKTLSKILLSCAAVMSLSAVMAVSAFAADNDITDKYTAGTDTANPTIAVPNSPAAAGAQGTIIIYKGQTATQDSIVYIDQDTVNADQDNWKETKLPASVDTIPDGEKNVTYTVKMGGTGVDANSVAVYTFTVGEVGDVTTGKIGDVNNDGVVDLNDALAIIDHVTLTTILDKDSQNYKNALITPNDSDVDLQDALDVVDYCVLAPSYIAGTKK